MSDSNIEWTEATWNPVVGCTAVSPGCKECYAATMACRLVAMQEGQRAKAAACGAPDPGPSPYVDVVRARPGAKMRTGAAAWSGDVRLMPERLAEPLRWRKPRLVFAPSMSDFGHPGVPFDYLAAVFAVMAATPHVYQVLTKRPGRVLAFLDWLGSCPYHGDSGADVSLGRLEECWLAHDLDGFARTDEALAGVEWPPPNIWLGVSVEDQSRADGRLPLLDALRARGWHTFVSAEPLLGPVEGAQWAAEWVIIGGESGPRARRCDAGWMRTVRDEARAAGARVFVKQLGLAFDDRQAPVGPRRVGAGLDLHPVDEAGVTRLRHRKGADMAEWPADLRLREWPPEMQAVLGGGA